MRLSRLLENPYGAIPLASSHRNVTTPGRQFRKDPLPCPSGRRRCRCRQARPARSSHHACRPGAGLRLRSELGQHQARLRLPTGGTSARGGAVRACNPASESPPRAPLHHRLRVPRGNRRSQAELGGDHLAPPLRPDLAVHPARAAARPQGPTYRDRPSSAPPKQKEAVLPEHVVAMLEALDRGTRDRATAPCC